MRFDNIFHTDGAINDGLVMMARTTSGSKPAPRWSIPEAFAESREHEDAMRVVADRLGVKVYGGGGSHLWFWWSKDAQAELSFEVMRDLTLRIIHESAPPGF